MMFLFIKTSIALKPIQDDLSRLTNLLHKFFVSVLIHPGKSRFRNFCVLIRKDRG